MRPEAGRSAKPSAAAARTVTGADARRPSPRMAPKRAAATLAQRSWVPARGVGRYEVGR